MSDKKIYLWAKTDKLDDLLPFDKNIVKAFVGGLYYVHVKYHENGTSVYTSGEKMPRWFGRLDNQEVVKKWAIADEAARQIVAIKAVNTKASKVAPLDEIYNDLWRVSRKLNTTEKCALIAKLSEIIMRV